MLAECSDILIKYGGHERAAGLSAEYENIEELGARLNDYADENNIEIEEEKLYNIECEADVENITCDVVRELEVLEPFGNDNPTPMFAVVNCGIINIIPMGENRHIRLEFVCGKFSFEAVYFNMEADKFGFNKYDYVDMACNIGINEFMNREKVQYIIRDIRLNEKYEREYLSEKENYYRFIKNDFNIKLNKNDIPVKDDFKSVYIFLLNYFKKDVLYEREYNINKLQSEFYDNTKIVMPRFKFRVIFDIFNEMGIIYAEHDFDNINKIKIYSRSVKINLDNSDIYIKLKSLDF